MFNETTRKQLAAEGFNKTQIEALRRAQVEIAFRAARRVSTSPASWLDQKAARILRFAAMFIPGGACGAIERTSMFFESPETMEQQEGWRPLLHQLARDNAQELAGKRDSVDAAIAFQLVAAVAEGGAVGYVNAALAYSKLIMRQIQTNDVNSIAQEFFNA